MPYEIAIFPWLLLTTFTALVQNAIIKIDVDRTIGEIDPKIYGVFMEPITISGRRGMPDSPQLSTLYGTLYDPSFPLANEDGFKKDYIDAMKDLKMRDISNSAGKAGSVH